MEIPRHIAIIMDGNGRWAQRRLLPRAAGHREGARTVRRIVEACCRLGVGWLTLYAFSTENWKRPQTEVDALMALLSRFLVAETPEMVANGIRLRVIGDQERLPAGVCRNLKESCEATASGQSLVLTLALSYGGRDEIVRAARKLAAEVQAGRLAPDDISEAVFAEALDSAACPEPDLLIRTGGEQRISNFLLWQMAYGEMVFTTTLWPDFDETDLRAACEEFSRRSRRFGRIPAQ